MILMVSPQKDRVTNSVVIRGPVKLDFKWGLVRTGLAYRKAIKQWDSITFSEEIGNNVQK